MTVFLMPRVHLGCTAYGAFRQREAATALLLVRSSLLNPKRHRASFAAALICSAIDALGGGTSKIRPDAAFAAAFN